MCYFSHPRTSIYEKVTVLRDDGMHVSVDRQVSHLCVCLVWSHDKLHLLINKRLEREYTGGENIIIYKTVTLCHHAHAIRDVQVLTSMNCLCMLEVTLNPCRKNLSAAVSFPAARNSIAFAFPSARNLQEGGWVCKGWSVGERVCEGGDGTHLHNPVGHQRGSVITGGSYGTGAHTAFRS